MWCFPLLCIYSTGPILGSQNYHHHHYSVEETEYRDVLFLYILSWVTSPCFCLLCIHSPFLCSLLFVCFWVCVCFLEDTGPLHTQSMWFSQGQPLPQHPLEPEGRSSQTISCLWHTTQVSPVRIPKSWDFDIGTFFFSWECWGGKLNAAGNLAATMCAMFG